MPLPILSINPYPNVPNVLGVPALLRKATPVLDAIQYVSHVGNVIDQLTNAAVDNTWGVFDASGDVAIAPDSFISHEYRNSQQIANYPVEQGGFASFNKVNDPFEATITMAKGGSVDDRESFLKSIEDIVTSTDLFTVVTPEATYESVNLTAFDYQRSMQNGAYLIIVSLHFKEVRVTAVNSGNASVVQAPDAANIVSTGQVAPVTLQSQITGAIKGAAKTLQSVKAAASTATARVLEGITL